MNTTYGNFSNTGKTTGYKEIANSLFVSLLVSLILDKIDIFYKFGNTRCLMKIRR